MLKAIEKKEKAIKESREQRKGKGLQPVRALAVRLTSG